MQLTVPTLCVKKGFQKSADFWNPNLKNQISADYGQSEAEAILDGLADKRNAANGQIFPNTSFR